jgi:hypothetical protein
MLFLAPDSLREPAFFFAGQGISLKRDRVDKRRLFLKAAAEKGYGENALDGCK